MLEAVKNAKAGGSVTPSQDSDQLREAIVRRFEFANKYDLERASSESGMVELFQTGHLTDLDFDAIARFGVLQERVA